MPTSMALRQPSHANPQSRRLQLKFGPPSLVHARAALAGLDEGTFTEGHELDSKTEKQVPKEMIGRRLSQEEAKRLLAKLE
jgi:hypothetical protein